MKLKLKQALGGSFGEFNPGDEIEIADVAEAQRLVLRGIAQVAVDPKTNKPVAELPAVSPEERERIVSGRVTVTKVRGTAVANSDVGERNWKDQYRPLEKSDLDPKRQDRINRMFGKRPKGKQARAYAPAADK